MGQFFLQLAMQWRRTYVTDRKVFQNVGNEHSTCFATLSCQLCVGKLQELWNVTVP